MVLAAALVGCGLVLCIEIFAGYHATSKVRPEKRELSKEALAIESINSSEKTMRKEGITNVESGEIERFDEEKRDLSKRGSKTLLVAVKEYIE